MQERSWWLRPGDSGSGLLSGSVWEKQPGGRSGSLGREAGEGWRVSGVRCHTTLPEGTREEFARQTINVHIFRPSEAPPWHVVREMPRCTQKRPSRP